MTIKLLCYTDRLLMDIVDYGLVQVRKKEWYRWQKS